MADQEVKEILRTGRGFRAVKLAIYRLSDQKIVGYEMLSRGPEGPLSRPDEFLRASIECGLLTEVDIHCFKRCLDATRDLDPELRIHINIYPSTLCKIPLDELESWLPSNRDRSNFCIEIVEQEKVGNIALLESVVHKLRLEGTLLAIDDVGFGGSTLENLIVLEPEIIKIDRSYVTGAGGDPVRERHLRRLVRTAEALGAELVAEGVESQADIDILRIMEVEFGQGLFWGPLP